MRQSPSLQKIQENMLPGSLSAHGFLGDDTRNLIDILESDDSVVKQLGITHEALAERMYQLTKSGRPGLGTPVIVDDIFEVVVEDYRGFISCPFRDHFRSGKRNTRVKNLKTGEEISWTDLNHHMICKHGFYEGMGSIFRVEPAKLAAVLEIHPG